MSRIDATARPLHDAALPLMRLVHHLTGMETSFVTSIDWQEQTQEILVCNNAGALQIPEGNLVAWTDSGCRPVMLAGRWATTVGDGTHPPAALAGGMTTFFTVPILDGDTPIGTVCGASSEQVHLDEHQHASMQLIAQSLSGQLQLHLAFAAARREAAANAEATRKMRHLAYTDPLTGLPNRRAFLHGLEEAMARSAARGFDLAVMLVDLDRFKQVNDSRGHAAGDELLKAVASALASVSRSPDIPARLGGDEFALAVTHQDEEALRATANRLRTAFASIAQAQGVDATLSIGIASSAHCHRDHLLAAADGALYRRKAAGGDGADVYDPSMDEAVATA